VEDGVNSYSARTESGQDLPPYEQLTMALSSSFCALDADDVPGQLTRALAEIGATFGADECTLVAYEARGEASVTESWAAPPREPVTNADLPGMAWLLARVARGTVVMLTADSVLPQSAWADRSYAARTGIVARLAVPVVLGTRVCFAMILGARHRHLEWNDAAARRLRLAGEIIGGGLERLVHQAPSSPAPAAPALGAPAPTGPVPSLIAPGSIIGSSPAFAVALDRLNQVAPLDVTVMLCGETGTGKELFAKALHERSRRHRGPFVRVNCAELPPTLIESELFGHERGAFTGATALRQGRFELADGGTIFLDEIGDLAPELQAKLLRALQEGEFERVGSSKVRSVDVRIVAATHVDLEAAVAEERFRADLYYRLNVFPITLPPLRERRRDIQELVWAFIRRRQRDLGRQITTVPPAILDALTRYDWPGNVRELENVIERALIRSTDGTLRLDHALDTAKTTSTDQTLDAVQRQYIEKVLRECGGRINGAGNAAVRLGLHPNTLRFRIRKLGVTVPRREDAATQPPAERRPAVSDHGTP
jgi:transcriptional regulator with GAF, ATPase, and Fis domain